METKFRYVLVGVFGGFWSRSFLELRKDGDMWTNVLSRIFREIKAERIKPTVLRLRSDPNSYCTVNIKL